MPQNEHLLSSPTLNILNIAPASATRAFTNYRKKYPNNIKYDVSKTRYSIASNFKAAFKHSVSDALDLVLKGRVILNNVLDIKHDDIFVLFCYI